MIAEEEGRRDGQCGSSSPFSLFLREGITCPHLFVLNTDSELISPAVPKHLSEDRLVRDKDFIGAQMNEKNNDNVINFFNLKDCSLF